MSLTQVVLAFALCICTVYSNHNDLVAEASGHIGHGHGHSYGHSGYGYDGYGHGGHGHGGYGDGGYGHGYHYGPFSYGYKGPHSHVDVSVKGPHAEHTSYGFKAGGYGGYKHY